MSPLHGIRLADERNKAGWLRFARHDGRHAPLGRKRSRTLAGEAPMAAASRAPPHSNAAAGDTIGLSHAPHENWR
jgi:hypothetical protein